MRIPFWISYQMDSSLLNVNSLTRAIDEEIAQITLQYVTGILFLIRLRIPIFLLTLLREGEILSSQINFSLTIAPRNLVCRFLSNGLLSMLTLKSAVIGLVVNSIKYIFLTLTESLFSLNQLFISASALFARTDSWYMSVSYRNTLVPSANNSNSASLLNITLSIIYKWIVIAPW